MKTNQTFESVRVHLIDKEKMHKGIEPLYNKPVKTIGFEGLILEPRVCLIDTDIVSMSPREDDTFVLDVYEADKKNSFSIIPFSAVQIPIEEMKTYLTGETVSLAKFTEERRGYNSRLIANERKVSEWLSEAVKV